MRSIDENFSKILLEMCKGTIDNFKIPNKEIYFIDGHGSLGRTFLFKTLIYYFTSINKILTKFTSINLTNIASILLPKGMTSH